MSRRSLRDHRRAYEILARHTSTDLLAPIARECQWSPQRCMDTPFFLRRLSTSAWEPGHAGPGRRFPLLYADLCETQCRGPRYPHAKGRVNRCQSVHRLTTRFRLKPNEPYRPTGTPSVSITPYESVSWPTSIRKPHQVGPFQIPETSNSDM